MSAVLSSQAFLLFQIDGRDAGRTQRFAAADLAAVSVAGLAFAHRHQSAGGERRQITGASERTVFVDHRGDAGVQHIGVDLRGFRAHTGASGAQGAQAQHQQAAHHLTLHFRSGTGGMRADQTFLQLRALFLGDGSGGERAESGGDTVMRHGVVGQMIDNRATQRHLMLRFVRNRHFGTAARYGDNVLDAQRSNTYGDRLLCHAHTFLYMCRIPHIRHMRHMLRRGSATARIRSPHLPINSRRRKRDQSLPE